MTGVEFAPGLVLIAGALALLLVPAPFRPGVFIGFGLVAALLVWSLPDGALCVVRLAGHELVLCNVDPLSRIFGTIFSLITIMGGIYAYHVKESGQGIAALLYAGSALGVVFSGDYLTLFIFWELMAISSTYLIWARQTVEGGRAGMRYLIVHLFGGSLLLAGIILHSQETGSLLVAPLSPEGGISTWLILAGVALNAAIPPLHAWLADAYPKATITGAVFLSAFTTKTAVYVLVRVFPGFEVLVFLGVLMALYGVVYAVLANDIREILAYHIISQVGYMVAGVGIGTEMALNGTVAHAFSHILYKSLLFMGAGVVLHTTGRSKLTELGGLYKAMPVTFWLYMVGAFSISGFPLFNGFISKSMVISAAAGDHRDLAMLLLTLASVGTFLHTGLKLPYFTWFGRPSGSSQPAIPKPPRTMHIAMGFTAFMCILFGVMPSLLYRHLPFQVLYEPYTIPHLVEAVQLLLFTFLGFWILRGKLAGEQTLSIDTDWFYRRPARLLRTITVDGVSGSFDAVDGVIMNLVKAVAKLSRNPIQILRWSGGRHVPDDFHPDHSRKGIDAMVGFVIVIIVVVGLLALVGRLL